MSVRGRVTEGGIGGLVGSTATSDPGNAVARCPRAASRATGI
jgi:hypothetical protein